MKLMLFASADIHVYQVEKQEKPKVPKGRAKKRLLYNRRFVNVTLAPGGKRKMYVSALCLFSVYLRLLFSSASLSRMLACA